MGVEKISICLEEEVYEAVEKGRGDTKRSTFINAKLKEALLDGKRKRK